MNFIFFMFYSRPKIRGYNPGWDSCNHTVIWYIMSYDSIGSDNYIVTDNNLS